ncbi:SF-assemblin [Spironucleus salmonicida]|uniref:SF-assemblin n=1 Tax=Spironucleus salmonicida TaxID=348837 RepID=V6LEI9_9EUKA|nr:SF-assemblin [Spironucleus salmonicida]|eukprot:EST42116.1 SF-assemblin [Spironucleus salmonicida]
MTHFSTHLDVLNDDLLSFNESLYQQVKKFNLHNASLIKLIQSTLQHLDRVLQIESRQRDQNFLDVKARIQQQAKDIEVQFLEQIEDVKVQNHIFFTSLNEQNNELISELQNQKILLNNTLLEWKSSNTKSTAMIKTNLDTKRAERIQRVSDLRDIQETQHRSFNQKILFWQNSVEQSLVNMVVYGQNIEKSYENGNKDDLQDFERWSGKLKKQLEDEISTRKVSSNNLNKTISIAMETLQNSMNQLGEFYE